VQYCIICDAGLQDGYIMCPYHDEIRYCRKHPDFEKIKIYRKGVRIRHGRCGICDEIETLKIIEDLVSK
jgi:hypothetical protein